MSQMLIKKTASGDYTLTKTNLLKPTKRDRQTDRGGESEMPVSKHCFDTASWHLYALDDCINSSTC